MTLNTDKRVIVATDYADAQRFAEDRNWPAGSWVIVRADRPIVPDEWYCASVHVTASAHKHPDIDESVRRARMTLVDDRKPDWPWYFGAGKRT
jgi:hypothetical protein